ncbi:hypothetical protein [Jeotgalibacillus marinus]|uniref:Phage protein n=1 Tax=Jeotgalibacillus marinus TaxID=86667 RepID=A0ABV3Q792_9BACL
MHLTLNGNQYELKFTYLSLLAIEQHYKQGVFKVFQDKDMNNLETLTVFIWACLRREKKFRKKSVEDVAMMVDSAIENEEISLNDLAEAIQEGFQNSTIIKNANDVNDVDQDIDDDKKK